VRHHAGCSDAGSQHAGKISRLLLQGIVNRNIRGRLAALGHHEAAAGELRRHLRDRRVTLPAMGDYKFDAAVAQVAQELSPVGRGFAPVDRKSGVDSPGTLGARKACLVETALSPRTEQDNGNAPGRHQLSRAPEDLTAGAHAPT
jgi:hypothetical protein